MRGKGLKLPREDQVGYQENFILRKSGDALEQAAHGGDGVILGHPGDVQEQHGCGTERHGLERLQAWVDGLTR